ncbi:hypothetical protein QRD43_20550 [Pelomonas sp. APW6]|uniref:Uncharacterized protein n=1 Tax=Roseateles subflavus TaxID=3053353 RepID=A0ABT7LNC9_9BURK|nr:hypothetical protein [Pelomonas sp. APW6]MDL5034304.1 hypothetical protein [Pelomonas sp. APW6]
MTPQTRNEIRDAAPVVSRVALRVSWYFAFALLVAAIAAAIEAAVVVTKKPEIHVQTDNGDVFLAEQLTGAERDKVLEAPGSQAAIRQALDQR